MNEPFRKTFTASACHIDVMGHVNNAVWVQWVQDLATAHWDAVADPVHAAQFIWLVIRHEIDYRGNISEGGSVTGEVQGQRPWSTVKIAFAVVAAIIVLVAAFLIYRSVSGDTTTTTR